MLRRSGKADDVPPTLPAVFRAVHAALVCGPHLPGLRAGAEERRNGGRWLWPAVAHALPALGIETAIEPSIGAASHVCRVRSGRRGYDDRLRLPGIDRHAPQLADLEAGARRAPRLAGIVALEVSVAGSDA